MSFDENHIEKVIKSNLDNFEIAPPEEVWGEIEGTLLKNKAIVRRNKIIASVVIVALISLLFVFFNSNRKADVKQDGRENKSVTPIIISDTGTSNTIISIQTGSNKKEIVLQKNSLVNKIEMNDKSNMDSTIQIKPIAEVQSVDSIPVKNGPAEKVVVKKVIKKPVYIVQQDTIYKVDTLSKKKKW